VGLKKQQKHECGYIDCPSCHEYIEAASHQCFIQIPKTPKCRTKAKAEDYGDDDDDEKSPILVFFDIEAM